MSPMLTHTFEEVTEFNCLLRLAQNCVKQQLNFEQV